MTGPLARLAQSSAVHFLVAFGLMGGWALFANRLHPSPAPIFAGIVQGTLSGLITLFLKRVVEALAARLGGVTALVAPPAIAAALSTAILVAIHSAAGTPEILRTIAVPLAVSTSYAAIYSLSLWRMRA